MGPIRVHLIKALTFIVYNFRLYKNPTMVDYQQDYDRVDHNEDEYDADNALLQGSNKTRRFTDVFCFVIFALAIIGFFAVMAITGGKGDVSNVAIPVDRDGNLCGRNNGTSGDFTNYKWLYLNPNDIANNASLSFKNRVCVMSCPHKNERISCPPFAYGSYCGESTTNPNENTLEYFGRFCLPSSKNLFQIIVDQFFGMFGGQKYAQDIVDLWWIILIGIFLAIGISIL
jgi:hypothetical protein